MKKQMKTAFFGVLTALLGVVIFAGMSLSAMAYEGSATDGVRVRSSASTAGNDNVIGELTAGQKVEITGETTDGNGQVWYQISYNGGTGYVSGAYIKTDGNAAAANTTASNTKPADADVTSLPEMDAKTTQQVNVRGGAGTDYVIQGELTADTAVKVTGEAKDATGAKWYRIRYNGESVGYVRNDFLEVDESSAVAATTEEEDPTEAATGAGTAEAPVTEDPGAGTNPGGTMGQQFTVAYSDNGTAVVPYLVDHNSSSQVEVSKLLESYNEVATLRAQAKQGNIIKIVCVILALVAIVAIVLLVIVGMRFRKYLEGGDPSYDDDGDFDDEDDYGDDGDYDDDGYDDEEDDYEDEPQKKKGGFFARFKKNRRDDYDDEDDEDYDDEDYDDEDEIEEPRNAIGRVYSPERKPQSSYDDDYDAPPAGGRVVTPNRSATKRPRNFMEEEDDFEYGFLDDDE